MTQTTATNGSILNDELLQRCRERAPGYDESNQFFAEDFDVERLQGVLEEHDITPRDGAPGPLKHWISLRMPNRGGAPEGTPELYFSDPDGLSIQLQDVAYCGGTGYLGGVCD